ncbi:hypothetical protein ACN6LM_003869 [Streptomyces sp. SAS_281]|uniref:hypothetical protein n=1 Tax=Streptomyces sp. SAS_281 TaxID=3412744 RepID=UPI00403CDCDF
MTTDNTAPVPTGTFADLLPAIEAVTYLAKTFPHLPAPYTVLGQGAVIDLQADTPDAFDAWRTALQIPPAAVELHAYAEGAWLHATTIVRGVPLVLMGYGLPLTYEQARTEQDPAGIAPTKTAVVYSLSDLAGGAA